MRQIKGVFSIHVARHCHLHKAIIKFKDLFHSRGLFSLCNKEQYHLTSKKRNLLAYDVIVFHFVFTAHFHDLFFLSTFSPFLEFTL